MGAGSRGGGRGVPNPEVDSKVDDWNMIATRSWASSPARRRIMQAIKPRDTRPELAIRRLIHAQGLRYRVSFRPIPDLRRTADVVFTRRRVAVFIDGCFWHSCPAHGREPMKNSEYWLPKLQRNRERDAETNTTLTAAGWTVLRYWEHESPAEVAAAISAVVRGVDVRSVQERGSTAPSTTHLRQGEKPVQDA